MNFNTLQVPEVPQPEHLDYYGHALRGFDIVVCVLLRYFDAVFVCCGVVVCWPFVQISKHSK